MLTTDPIYYKPLLPIINISETDRGSTPYTYSAFTGSPGLGILPLYCSVSLSQNTHGEFTIQFDDPGRDLEDMGIGAGWRVTIDCGKQSTSVTRLISGLIRQKGWTRGSDNKMLYTISGTSTGIRLNERVIYSLSEAARTPTDAIDYTDGTRTAAALLASNLSMLTSDGILSVANLEINSDVETFIASLSIEYGELQDLVNYIEDQSGGEVVVDTGDAVNFRHEIKNNIGKGFTIKNNNTNKANDDADDTMYMRGKDWNYLDDFYKSTAYANRIYAILPADSNIPSSLEDMGYFSASVGTSQISNAPALVEYAVKFRPSHSHWVPGDIFVVMVQVAATADKEPWNQTLRICTDTGGVPTNAGGIVANIRLPRNNFPSATTAALTNINEAQIPLEQQFLNTLLARINSFDLNTTQDYWLIMANDGIANNDLTYWGNTATTRTYASHTSSMSNAEAGGAAWTVTTGNPSPVFEQPRMRATSFVMWDPKAVQAVQSGLTGGLYTDSVLSDNSALVKNKEAMYRHLSQQLYDMARPRTTYNLSQVTAPNIPPQPGDSILISDSVLGLSTTNNQVIPTICGDMSYTWGNLNTGSYEAPTVLSINAVGIHPRYR